VSEEPERDRFPTDHREASYSDDFFADMVEENDLWSLPLLEVTTNRFSYPPWRFSQRVRFGKDGLSERAR
jgi:hypothetical protein